MELEASVNDIADGLIALGVRPGDRVALLAETRPEWTICDLAIAGIGAICVPVYPTSSAEEIAWVLGDSEARAVICDLCPRRGEGAGGYSDHPGRVARVGSHHPTVH